ncbi:hypothetical protein EPA93_23410 [Ktedonosporobacter rubrisoli]|uniref:Uncharacterized protein n=1 Tax=Ktedonosporobacter rubrisoli TaxID=2509675 RepID=A0A4P6JTX4_KTERU|nr:hypothetical protein [Ktedonosporobacter rubrisoli]QBD78773.1 hypothetical protein EPA93_23410 [Ktedonosporobacter rubrisoli]
MSLRNVLSGLLAAFIALPMYYMLYEIFNKGFEVNTFLVALIIGVATFIVTLAIILLVSRVVERSKQAL